MTLNILSHIIEYQRSSPTHTCYCRNET